MAAIEFVSPRNKDRPETRRAFATKCASYLHQGVSLIIVDTDTTRQSNLHNEIMAIIQAPDSAYLREDAGLYAVAYRPVRRDAKEEVDLWPTNFSVGSVLPTLPLWLNWETHLSIDFEATYVDACRRLRLA